MIDMTTENPWKLLEAEEPFSCPYFTVRSDVVSYEGGQRRRYNSIRMKMRGVAVLPIDSQGRTTLVGQHRYVLGRYSWELPGGGAPVDGPAIETARAELSEETGLVANRWLELFAIPVAPGTLDEITTGFVAWDVHAGRAHPDTTEQIAIRTLPFPEAVGLALSGDLGHISSVAAILALHTRLLRGELPEDLANLLK
jgi:8-oxo-dGTP pyrophosphatase MutT (NUDIX family)